MSRVALHCDTKFCAFDTESLDLRGHFHGHLRVYSRVHFREHFRERDRGSDFAFRVLSAFLNKSWDDPNCKKKTLANGEDLRTVVDGFE